MLEIWFAKVKTAVQSSQVGSWRWVRILTSGLGISVLVLAVVLGRLLWVQADRPKQRQAITEAFGSARLFFGLPQVNRDGCQMTYIASAENRCALFLANTRTGRSQKLVESATVGWEANLGFRAGPWSPDDRAFTYFLDGWLVVYPTPDNASGAEVWKLDAKGVSSVVWVNPTEFVYLKERTIWRAQKSGTGQWETKPVPVPGGVSSLTVMSTNTIAWLRGNFIGRLNLEAPLPRRQEAAAVDVPVSTGPPPTNGLVLWLDAATLALADQSPVTGLADLSRMRNDAVLNQNPPTYNAPSNSRALQGKGTIRFTSANSITNATGLKTLRRLGLTNNMPRTVFALLRREAGRPMMAVNLGETGGHGTFFGVYDQANALYLPGGWDWLDNTVPPASGNWNLLEVVYDGATQNGYVNGALKGVTAFPLNTADKEVEIGLRTGKNAAGSDGDFAELLIYDRALEADERHRVEGYLSAKWFGGKLESAPISEEWGDAELNGLVSLSWSTAAGRFLVQRTVQGRTSLWQFDPEAVGTNRWSPIAGSDLIQNAQWTEDGMIAGISTKPGQRGVVLTDRFRTETTRLFEHGRVTAIQVPSEGSRLFVLGTVSNEPAAGIWQYDLVTKRLQPVIPGAAVASRYALNQPPSTGDLRLPSGRSVSCFLYPPLNRDPHKKYPLVLLNTTYQFWEHGEPEQQWLRCAAACGAYVVIIHRPGWFTGIEQWGENVLGVYESLKRDPAIDPSRVYLAGSSAETPHISRFIEQHPGPWRGVALLNPAGLPDLTKFSTGGKRPKILIEECDNSGGRSERLQRFQEAALSQGMLVEVVVHPNDGHRIMGNTARLERTRNMMRFIFEE